MATDKESGKILSTSSLDYSTPNAFSTRQKLELAIIPRLITWTMSALWKTVRCEFRDEQHWRDIIDGGRHGILATWHESMLLAACHFRNSDFHTLTSYSYDGEIAARVVGQLGIKAIRGSSSRGGPKAINELQKAVEMLPMIGLTLDGPKGPRRVAKPGAAILSVRSKNVPIVPMAFAVEPAWRLNSWDRLLIPKPFSRVVGKFGKPIFPPRKGMRGGIESLRLQVENELNKLHTELETEVNPDQVFPDVR